VAIKDEFPAEFTKVDLDFALWMIFTYPTDSATWAIAYHVINEFDNGVPDVVTLR